VRLRWSRRAASQLFEAADYLEDARRGAGDGLYTAVDRVVALIKEQPWAFPGEPHAAHPNVRRALVLRYGYWLVYRIEGNDVEILVLAFWSTRQHPHGWMR
jgi:plasmid stabilization system protein ParE